MRRVFSFTPVFIFMLRGFSLETLLGTQRAGALQRSIAHVANCACGCVPNIMSLHEQANERARRREAAAVRKPTVGEVLLMREQALLHRAEVVRQQSRAGDAEMLATECDDDDDDDQAEEDTTSVALPSPSVALAVPQAAAAESVAQSSLAQGELL